MTDDMDSGCYQLIIELPRKTSIKIGALGFIEFKPGYYIYTGRARKNLQKRVERHCSKNKKNHWHIDYLLEKASVNEVIYYVSRYDECVINDETRNRLEGTVIKKFGSSDCGCSGHLIRVGKKPKL